MKLDIVNEVLKFVPLAQLDRASAFRQFRQFRSLYRETFAVERVNSGEPQRVTAVVILSQALQACREGAETRWCNANSLCNTSLAPSTQTDNAVGDDIVQTTNIVRWQ